jgi:hypothetical protein
VIWVWDIVNMSLRYCDIVEILWYEFETYIGFENCTGFEFNFFLICIEPIYVGWIKSVGTNNLILVSNYLTQPIIIYSLLVSVVLGQPIPIMIITIADIRNVWFFISYRWYRSAWSIPITSYQPTPKVLFLSSGMCISSLITIICTIE